jgi:ketosteroid isomerase-like protein
VIVRAPRHTTGWKSLREDVARTLAPIAAVHVEPSGDVQAWKDGDHAWTTQDFHVTGSLKDGRGFTVEVRYSAVWRKIEKKWLIEYEHFLGPRPVAKTTPPNQA